MLVSDNIEVVFSLDTTGSMYPVLTQARRHLREIIARLYKDLSGKIKIGFIPHGDYVDGVGRSPYLTKSFDLSSDQEKICRFIDDVPPTFGGGPHAVYEHVLHEARKLSWTAGKSKVLVVIGDEPPHNDRWPDGKTTYNWKNELGLLKDMGVKVYGVQALQKRYATSFYETLASMTGGYKLDLEQFAAINELIMAVCYKQESDDILSSYEDELVNKGKMTRGVSNIFQQMLPARDRAGRFIAKDFSSVPAGRFQVMDIDAETRIDEFVRQNGLTFQKGRGFYQLTKYENAVQPHKEIILEDKRTGDMFSGTKSREILGLPLDRTVSLSPTAVATKGSDDAAKYNIFIQSTSLNRNLKAHSRFLYEVEDWK